MINDLKYYCNGDFHPTIGSEEAAGIDLYNNGETVEVGYQRSVQINTKTVFEIPKGWVGLLYMRGGHGVKGFQLNNCVGVVDSDYRGEVMANVHINLESSEHRIIEKGERFCQMVIVPHMIYNLIETKDLNETERGDGRHNSTGKY